MVSGYYLDQWKVKCQAWLRKVELIYMSWGLNQNERCTTESYMAMLGWSSHAPPHLYLSRQYAITNLPHYYTSQLLWLGNFKSIWKARFYNSPTPTSHIRPFLPFPLILPLSLSLPLSPLHWSAEAMCHWHNVSGFDRLKRFERCQDRAVTGVYRGQRSSNLIPLIGLTCVSTSTCQSFSSETHKQAHSWVLKLTYKRSWHLIPLIGLQNCVCALAYSHVMWAWKP